MKDRSVATLVTLLLSLLLLVGCTTTTTVNGMATQDLDKEKALENRLKLALGYMSKGDRERARHHLERAMEINSRSPEVHDVWALLYQQEMELEEAEEHYRKALSYDPGFTRSRNNYGSFLFRQERYEEAYQQFRTASEDLAYPKRAEVFLKMGVTALKLDKRQEAEEAFKKSIVLEPELSQSYLELAGLAFSRGDYQRAKQLLEKYNQNRPTPTPRGLWLGVRLANQLGDRDMEASQGLALRNLFPDSRENQEYQHWLNDERNR